MEKKQYEEKRIYRLREYKESTLVNSLYGLLMFALMIIGLWHIHVMLLFLISIIVKIVDDCEVVEYVKKVTKTKKEVKK